MFIVRRSGASRAASFVIVPSSSRAQAPSTSVSLKLSESPVTFHCLQLAFILKIWSQSSTRPYHRQSAVRPDSLSDYTTLMMPTKQLHHQLRGADPLLDASRLAQELQVVQLGPSNSDLAHI
ncbi:hypothetical protein BCR34DRAFT_606894 [Clohesyomyces aquaticus]|uniref:Uncharacterized protein n=1 Tax=Clohesyomyces aquaticus TaxID=1231657 RepID=A0A1Y1YKI1_9PLEO|nr:hypothetical protein BCR34DRAFT_606894 [Clohesyomyces aquaticus]